MLSLYSKKSQTQAHGPAHSCFLQILLFVSFPDFLYWVGDVLKALLNDLENVADDENPHSKAISVAL